MRGIAECAGSVLCRFFSKFDLLFLLFSAKINEIQIVTSSDIACEIFIDSFFLSSFKLLACFTNGVSIFSILELFSRK